MKLICCLTVQKLEELCYNNNNFYYQYYYYHYNSLLQIKLDGLNDLTGGTAFAAVILTMLDTMSLSPLVHTKHPVSAFFIFSVRISVFLPLQSELFTAK